MFRDITMGPAWQTCFPGYQPTNAVLDDVSQKLKRCHSYKKKADTSGLEWPQQPGKRLDLNMGLS